MLTLSGQHPVRRFYFIKTFERLVELFAHHAPSCWCVLTRKRTSSGLACCLSQVFLKCFLVFYPIILNTFFFCEIRCLPAGGRSVAPPSPCPRARTLHQRLCGVFISRCLRVLNRREEVGIFIEVNSFNQNLRRPTLKTKNSWIKTWNNRSSSRVFFSPFSTLCTADMCQEIRFDFPNNRPKYCLKYLSIFSIPAGILGFGNLAPFSPPSGLCGVSCSRLHTSHVHKFAKKHPMWVCAHRRSFRSLLAPVFPTASFLGRLGGRSGGLPPFLRPLAQTAPDHLARWLYVFRC